MKFPKVPSAVRPILQLPAAHAGRWNFPKCHLPNLATEQKKHSVHIQAVPNPGSFSIAAVKLQIQYIAQRSIKAITFHLSVVERAKRPKGERR